MLVVLDMKVVKHLAGMHLVQVNIQNWTLIRLLAGISHN